MAAEFDSKSVDATMADPVVNHVPVITGGVGAREVRHFYTEYLIARHPPDTAIGPLTRTVGQDRIVDVGIGLGPPGAGARP
jgi:carboxymethylenebutenolidase